MKSMTLLVGLLCVCALGLAQGNVHYADAPEGVIYVYQTSSGEWIADGFPPNVDPFKIAKVNPAFLFPIDGSGPIPLNPTMAKRINPYFNLEIDKCDPGPGPYKRKYINPNFITPIEGVDPGPGPHKRRFINPNYLVSQD